MHLIDIMSAVQMYLGASLTLSAVASYSAANYLCAVAAATSHTNSVSILMRGHELT